MKPIQFKVPRLTEETVRVEYWDMNFFYDPIHFHEECQLTYIIEGKGSLYVGATITPFNEGDVYLFGKNLPHVLRCNEEYHTNGSSLHARAISVFFSLDTFVSLFKIVPESYVLEKLLDYSNYGVKVNSPVATGLLSQMQDLLKLSGFDRIVRFLSILNMISQSPNLTFISSGSIPLQSVVGEEPEINKVYKYILENFKDKVTLANVASMVYLTPSAFCRFFKSRTQKTFSRFLIEVRIGNACKMIAEGKYNTTECAYQVGYNNTSNFQRHFKSITGMTTTEFKTVLKKNHNMQMSDC